MHTIGSVQYVNAKPLIGWFDHLGAESPVRVLLDVPSGLPTLLDSGTAEAVMVSSFEALRTPNRTFAEGASISSIGDAKSVRLFSKVPFDQITSLALDRSSMTSNHLALGLLAERHGVKPVAKPEPPVLADMLSAYDACVLIGDIGMMTDGTGLHVMDLGREWTEWCDLPFVWALWIGGPDLSPELVGLLQQSRQWGEAHYELLVDRVVREAGWPFDRADNYLRHTMNYELTADHLAGYARYRDLLLEHGLLKVAHSPLAVAPVAPAAALG